MTPHVHHWDSMMVFEDTTKSLFHSDLFIQPGTNKPVVSEDLSEAMIAAYRQAGIYIDSSIFSTYADTTEDRICLFRKFVSTKTRNGCCLLGE